MTGVYSKIIRPHLEESQYNVNLDAAEAIISKPEINSRTNSKNLYENIGPSTSSRKRKHEGEHSIRTTRRYSDL